MFICGCLLCALQTYTDFHEDLFPDTAGPVPAMTAQEWFDGENKQVGFPSLSGPYFDGVCFCPQLTPKFMAGPSSLPHSLLSSLPPSLPPPSSLPLPLSPPLFPSFALSRHQVSKVSLKPCNRPPAATTSVDKKGVSGNASGGVQSAPSASAPSSNQTKTTQAQVS